MVFNKSDIEFEKKMVSAYRAYKELNRIRLEKTLNTISPEQRLYISVLPLLLHINEKGLPGYVEDTLVPSGLANFEWTNKFTELALELFP
jgi:adenylate cyclase class 1